MLPTKQATEILALWNEFEAAATADARFAKTIDCLQLTLLNHAVGGGTWMSRMAQACAGNLSGRCKAIPAQTFRRR